jgi:hypothetical protein
MSKSYRRMPAVTLAALLAAAPAIPRHPHMAPNGRSNIHDGA